MMEDEKMDEKVAEDAPVWKDVAESMSAFLKTPKGRVALRGLVATPFVWRIARLAFPDDKGKRMAVRWLLGEVLFIRLLVQAEAEERATERAKPKNETADFLSRLGAIARDARAAEREREQQTDYYGVHRRG